MFTLMMMISLFTGYWIETITLFMIVLVHEFGHVAAAKGFGWRVKEVKLLPFGGVAVVDEAGNVPALEEWCVALAGPLQHVWMIAAAMILKNMGAGDPVWWDYVIRANAMIGGFNLLPVLPLDGGRILQSLLSYAVPYHRALLFTVTVSLICSMIIVSGAVYTFFAEQLQLNLFVIGVFLLVSNWYAYRQIPYFFVRFLMSRGERMDRLSKQGAIAAPIVVPPQRQISDVLKLFMREKYHLIYVINDRGTIRAVLPEKHVVEGYFHRGNPGGAISELIM